MQSPGAFCFKVGIDSGFVAMTLGRQCKQPLHGSHSHGGHGLALGQAPVLILL